VGRGRQRRDHDVRRGVDARRHSRDARLHWRGARLMLPDGIPPLDLGDVRAALTASGDRVAGPVSNEGGDIAVRGEFALRASDAVRLSLHWPRAAPSMRASSAGALRHRQPRTDGWRVEWLIPLR